MNFQSPATYVMEGIVDLHHDIMSILIFIFVFVIYLLFSFLYEFHEDRTTKIYKVSHSTKWEVIWTVIPVLILMVIMVPSYSLLYSI
jgi:cytochrome c oxidase subunit 2